MVTPKKLLADISAGKYEPAYYFFGTEDYRIVEAEKFLARKFLPDRQLLTNYRRLDAKRTACADLIVELSSFPMLGERQVVAISDFQRLKPTQVDRILKMLSPPDPSRVVIFSTPASRMPKRKSSFLEKMSKKVVTVEFRRLTTGEAVSQITRGLKKEGLGIDSEAVNLLAQMLSGNRGGIEAETSKLVNYKQSGETVTVDDVRKVSSGYEAFGIFALADEVIAGRTGTVLRIIRVLIADGSSPVAIGILLQQHFVCLYLAKNGKKLLGNRAFLAGKFRAQATKYSNHRLERIIMEKAEADANLRRQNIERKTVLEMLALSLTGNYG